MESWVVQNIRFSIFMGDVHLYMRYIIFECAAIRLFVQFALRPERINKFWKKIHRRSAGIGQTIVGAVADVTAFYYTL